MKPHWPTAIPVLVLVGLAAFPINAQQAAPARPKPAPSRPSSPSPTVPIDTTSAPQNRPDGTAPAALAIGELTPVPPSTLPAEKVDGERATAADIGRLVEWLAYLGAVLYRAGSPDSTAIRDLYQQLDAARDETGTLLTRAREGNAPPAAEYAKVRSNLARLHERIRTVSNQ